MPQLDSLNLYAQLNLYIVFIISFLFFVTLFTPAILYHGKVNSLILIYILNRYIISLDFNLFEYSDLLFIMDELNDIEFNSNLVNELYIY